MARPVIIINGRAYDPETGQPIGYRPSEKRLPEPIGVGVERFKPTPAPPTPQKLREERRIREREQTIRGLSPEVLRRFSKRATQEEVEELITGTRIETITIGTKGTIRIKRPEGTELITPTREVEEGKEIRIETRRIVPEELKEPLIVERIKTEVQQQGSFTESILKRFGFTLEDLDKARIAARIAGAPPLDLTAIIPHLIIAKQVRKGREAGIKVIEIPEKKLKEIGETSGLKSVKIAAGLGSALLQIPKFPLEKPREAQALFLGAALFPAITRLAITGISVSQIPKIKEGFENLPNVSIERRDFARGQLVGHALLATAAAIPGILTGYQGLRTGIKTLGRQKIPLDRIGAPPDIVSATKSGRAPTAEQIIRSFKEKTFVPAPKGKYPYPKYAGLPKEDPRIIYGWHGAPKGLTNLEITGSTSELPGLYTAPVLQTYFTKVGRAPTKYKLFGISDLTLKDPAAVRIGAKGIKVIPKYIRDQGLPAMRRYILEQSLKGELIAPLMKAEFEAILPPGTKLTITGKRFYTEVNGKRVPIEEFKVLDAIEAAKIKAVGGKITTYAAVMKKYSSKFNQKTTALITPAKLSSLGIFGDTQPIQTRPESIAGESILDISAGAFQLSGMAIPETSKPKVKYGELPIVSRTAIERAVRSRIVPPSSRVNPFFETARYIREQRVRAISKKIITRKELEIPIAEPIVPPPPPPPSKKPPIRRIRKILEKIEKARAYQTFAKISGKWQRIGTPMIKHKALEYGQTFVGKQSLSAQYKVLPTTQFITGKELPFTSSEEFRGFKISLGKLIPLKDHFIEKKQYRLERAGREVELIKATRGMGFGRAKQTISRTSKKSRSFSFFK